MSPDESTLRRRQTSEKVLLPHEEPDDPDWPYTHGNIDTLGLVTGLSVMVISLSLVAFFRYQQYLRDIIITPLDAPLIFAANATNTTFNPEHLWGTYRPHTYFGLKTRSPKSPVFGTMWMTQFTDQVPPPIRHWCHENDSLHSYSWVLHDGKSCGAQKVEESSFTVTQEFVTENHGEGWTARITMTPKSDMGEVVVSAMLYVALDGPGHLSPKFSNNGLLTQVTGASSQIGFTLTFSQATSEKQMASYLIGYEPSLVNLTKFVQSSFKKKAWDQDPSHQYLSLGGNVLPTVNGPTQPANVIVKEVTAALPLIVEVRLESISDIDVHSDKKPEPFDGSHFDAAFRSCEERFDNKFSDLFQLAKKGYKKEEVKIAKAALSNVLGSVAYFHGASKVKCKYNKKPVSYWKAPLLSTVPSRSSFPGGSLQDEGFCNLLISHWDKGLSLEILGSWLDLLNTEGWIPRQQILDAEVHAKVPADIVIQYNEHAHPPSFFLLLQTLMEGMLSSQNPSDHKYLEALFPRLEAWYAWYNTTQAGNVFSAFRWRGWETDTPSSLSSELGHHLHAAHPTDNERHLDLRCWMALASGMMVQIAQSLNRSWHMYAATHELLTDNALLDSLHWSEQGQQYSDYGLHSDSPKPSASHQARLRSSSGISITTSEPQYQFVDVFNYVSLFPFFLKVLDTHSPKLQKILTDLRDPDLLWTMYGLRSSAPTSSPYDRADPEHQPYEWRSSVWINMNYLSLAALHHYAHTTGPYSKLAGERYEDLRSSVVGNVMNQYLRTGFFWEKYSDETGEGKGSHPSATCSALLVLIMAEMY